MKKKEILTDDIIKLECVLVCKDDIKHIIVAFLWSLIPQTAISLILIFHTITLIRVFAAFFLIVGFIPYFSYISKICKLKKIIFKINSNQFRIQEDDLIYAEELERNLKDNYRYGTTSAMEMHKPYRLVFNCGEYQIPKCANYAMSKSYVTNDRGIYNSSVKGDSFYLIIVNESDIIMAYNKEFFHYSQK